MTPRGVGFVFVLTQSPKRYHGTHGRSSKMKARLGRSTPVSRGVWCLVRISLVAQVVVSRLLTLCQLRPMDPDQGVERAVYDELRLGATCCFNIYGGANDSVLHVYFITPGYYFVNIQPPSSSLFRCKYDVPSSVGITSLTVLFASPTIFHLKTST